MAVPGSSDLVQLQQWMTSMEQWKAQVVSHISGLQAVDLQSLVTDSVRLAIEKMTDSGLEVTFTKTGGYVTNVATGETEVWFPREGNFYFMHQWIQEDSDGANEQSFGRRES